MEAEVVVPELDVADSVRRMLEATRMEQGAAAAERVPDGIPAAPVPAPAPPVAPLPAVAMPPAPPSAATSPVAPAAPSAPPARDSGHVPLPEREFTIRSVDDIRELARELGEAKQRQQGKQKN